MNHLAIDTVTNQPKKQTKCNTGVIWLEGLKDAGGCTLLDGYKGNDRGKSEIIQKPSRRQQSYGKPLQMVLKK